MKVISNVCDELEKQPQKKYVGKWLTNRKIKKLKEVCNEQKHLSKNGGDHR